MYNSLLSPTSKKLALSDSSDDVAIEIEFQAQLSETTSSIVSPLHGDVLRLCLSYVSRMEAVVQVCQSWRRETLALEARATLLHQRQTSQQDVVDCNNRYHSLQIAPEHLMILKSEIKAMKRLSNTHRPVLGLELKEIEYDESLAGAADRVRRGFPAFMTMHDAMQLLIDEGPWPHIVFLRLRTLDDHRTIFPAQLHKLFEVMPNANVLQLTTQSASRPALVKPSSNSFEPRTQKFVHTDEAAYQRSLFSYLFEDCTVCLVFLQLPAWTSSYVLMDLLKFYRRHGTTLGPIRSTLQYLEYEHRFDYDNARMIPWTWLLYFAYNFFPHLNRLDVNGIYVDSIDMLTAVQLLPNLNCINLMYHKVQNSENVQAPESILQPLSTIPIECINASSSMLPLTHCKPEAIIELGCVAVSDLLDDASTFVKLERLEVTCRHQTSASCDNHEVLAALALSQDTFIAKLSSFVWSAENLSVLVIHHLPYEWLPQLRTIRMPKLISLELLFDSTTIDLMLDWDCEKIDVRRRARLNLDNQSSWSSITDLKISAPHISVSMLHLALGKPKLLSLSLEQTKLIDSPYDWERLAADSELQQNNRNNSLVDEHLMLLSECPLLSQLSIIGCDLLTARCLMALSFVTTLQALILTRCAGLHHNDFENILRCDLDSKVIGLDTRPRGISNLISVHFDDCPSVLAEVPLKYPVRFRTAMMQWSESRFKQSDPLARVGSQRIISLQATQITIDPPTESFDGSTEICDQGPRRMSDLAECRYVTPPRLLTSLITGDITGLTLAWQWISLVLVALDRVNRFITPWHRACHTSHVDWQSSVLILPGGDTWKLWVRRILYVFIYTMVLGQLALVCPRFSSSSRDVIERHFWLLITVHTFLVTLVVWHKREPFRQSIALRRSYRGWRLVIVTLVFRFIVPFVLIFGTIFLASGYWLRW